MNMIFITGDIHGDKNRFKEIKKAKLKKGDTLIICGDFGFIWNNSKKEKRVLKWIGKRKYHVAFVDGYHDKLEFINRYPVTNWNGGKARMIAGKLVMLMRGEIYDIDDKSIFAFGGGVSLERENEVFEDKLPSQEEIDNAIQNLKNHNNKIDYIVTHDAPAKIKLFLDMNNNEVDHLHTFLETVSKDVKFTKWFFGKYHLNKTIPPYYYMLFTDVQKANS